MSIELSKKDFWDKIWSAESVTQASLGNYWMKKLITFLARYLEPDQDKRFVELGGAPGRYPLLFYKAFQYQPYVIDYSQTGIKETQKTFERFQVPTDNVILMDFLNENALAKYEDCFDIVFSAGLLEHFKDPSYVLGLHLKILKRGGDLIVTIPVCNPIFRLQPLLKKGVIEQHNLLFMNIEAFLQVLTSNKSMEIKYLGYFGGLNLEVPRCENFLVLGLIYVVQRFAELTHLESVIPPNKYTSPYLICVAKKKS